MCQSRRHVLNSAFFAAFPCRTVIAIAFHRVIPRSLPCPAGSGDAPSSGHREQADARQGLQVADALLELGEQLVLEVTLDFLEYLGLGLAQNGISGALWSPSWPSFGPASS